MERLILKRNLLLRKRHSRANVGTDTPQWDKHKFDEATGQMYTEQTVSTQSAYDWNWTHQTNVVMGPEFRDGTDDPENVNAWENGKSEEELDVYQEYIEEIGVPRVRGFKGARSLKDSAVETLLQNILDLTFEGVQCLPVQVARCIWNLVNKRCSVSLETWTIFSKLLHRDASTLSLLRYRQTIERPNLPLPMYASPLTSKSFDFITSLSLTSQFTVPDLVKLSSITNLGVLEIIDINRMRGYDNFSSDFHQGVSDRLLRTWQFAATNEGAFPVLRILKLWNHQDLTSQSLEYLNGFPALAVYDVRGCDFDLDAMIQARKLGWKPTTEENILGLLKAACSERVVLMQAFPYTEPKSGGRLACQELSNGAKIKRLPRSEVPVFLTGRELLQSEKMMALDYKGIEHYQLLDRKPRPQIPDNPRLGTISKRETWEFSTVTAFSRIGELRNDIDLARAGIEIGDQAVFGNELVSSVPMVSLRLGQTPASLLSSPANRTSQNTTALSFIRIKALPLPKAPKTGEMSSVERGSSGDIRAEVPKKCHPAKRKGSEI